MELEKQDGTLKFKLELIAVSLASVLGLALVIGGFSLLLFNIGIFKYVAAIIGILSGAVIGWVIIKHYLCFVAMMCLFQVGILASLLWALFTNQIDEIVMLSLWALVFLYTSKNYKRHWELISKALQS